MRPELSETDLLHAFMARAPLAMPHVRVFRRNIINVETKHGDRVRNGIPGMADCYCLIRGGTHVEIETKAADGRKREAQEAWRAWCRLWSVPHLTLRARPREPAETTVARWVDELRAVVGRS